MRYFTKLTYFCGLMLATLSVNAQNTLFWGGSTDPNSTFDGGPNGWTVVGVKAAVVDSAKNALWEFCPNGTFTKKGSFQGAGGVINSPSKANGAMGFNSDYLDNKGLGAASIGKGPAPAPHRGELISPVIDCSGKSTVELKFYQALRQFVSQMQVEVSNDGGATWTTYDVNTDVVTNSAHINNQYVLDITKTAANKNNVKIRFVYDCKASDPRGYYYWIVDDIELHSKPAVNLSLGSVNYPPLNYNTPSSQMDADTFQFIADVRNDGTVEQKNVKLKVQVTKGSTVLYTDSSNIGTIPVGMKSVAGSFLEGSAVLDSSFVLDKLWGPGALAADTALYRVTYTLIPETADERPTDNTKQVTFRVSNFNYWKEDGRNFGGLRPSATGTYYVGGLYTTSPNFNGKNYTFDQVSFVCSKNAADGTLAGNQATVLIGEINEQVVDKNWDNFDDSQLDFAFPYDDKAQINLVGVADYTFVDAQQADTVTVAVLDPASASAAPVLKPGNRYFVVVKYADDNGVIFHTFSTSFKNYNTGHTVVGTSAWFLGGFGSTRQATIRTDIKLTVKTDENPLPDNSLKLMPSLADQQMVAQINFDKQTNVSVVIADFNGKVIDVQDLEGITSVNHTVETASLPAGAYLIRLETKEGTKTQKFVVQH